MEPGLHIVTAWRAALSCTSITLQHCMLVMCVRSCLLFYWVSLHYYCRTIYSSLQLCFCKHALNLLDVGTGSDNDVVCADNEEVDSITDRIPTSGQSLKSLPVKNRLHRTHEGIELDCLPDYVQTGNASRKRRSTSDVTSPAEIMRRCEQWLNDVRHATSTSGLSGSHIGTVTTSGCQPAATDDQLTLV